MKKRFFSLYLLLGIALTSTFFSSCSDDESFLSVIAEEVIFTNSDIVRVLGRMVGTGEIFIEDHGFEVAENDQFTNAVRQSLGSRDKVGRFIGEISGLNTDKLFYIRAFYISNGQVSYSNVLTFTTLAPELDDYSPKMGLAGSTVIITGKNFTTDVKVFFGNKEAEIIGNKFDAELSVRVPLPENNLLVTLSVEYQGERIEFEEKFEYIAGHYEKLGDFPVTDQFFDNVYFQEGEIFYAGLGILNTNSLYDKMWEYSVATNQWSEIPFSGGFHGGGFLANGFFGSGVREFVGSVSVLGREFWKFENGQFLQMPNTPFESYRSPAFIIQDELYVIGESLFSPRIMNKYNLNTGQWTRLDDAPVTVFRTYANFTYNNKQYFVLNNSDLVEFDPAVNSWTKVGEYPGEASRNFGFGVIIGDKAYVGLYIRSNEIWELDLNSFEWTPKVNFPGTTFAHNAGVFIYNDEIYILRSGEMGTPNLTRMEFWKFDPNSL